MNESAPEVDVAELGVANNRCGTDGCEDKQFCSLTLTGRDQKPQWFGRELGIQTKCRRDECYNSSDGWKCVGEDVVMCRDQTTIWRGQCKKKNDYNRTCLPNAHGMLDNGPCGMDFCIGK